MLNWLEHLCGCRQDADLGNLGFYKRYSHATENRQNRGVLDRLLPKRKTLTLSRSPSYKQLLIHWVMTVILASLKSQQDTKCSMLRRSGSWKRPRKIQSGEGLGSISTTFICVHMHMVYILSSSGLQVMLFLRLLLLLHIIIHMQTYPLPSWKALESRRLRLHRHFRKKWALSVSLSVSLSLSLSLDLRTQDNTRS